MMDNNNDNNYIQHKNKNKNIILFNNDSLALFGLIVISLFSLFYQEESISAAAVGAVGGFIGSRNIPQNNNNN